MSVRQEFLRDQALHRGGMTLSALTAAVHPRHADRADACCLRCSRKAEALLACRLVDGVKTVLCLGCVSSIRLGGGKVQVMRR